MVKESGTFNISTPQAAYSTANLLVHSLPHSLMVALEDRASVTGDKAAPTQVHNIINPRLHTLLPHHLDRRTRPKRRTLRYAGGTEKAEHVHHQATDNRNADCVLHMHENICRNKQGAVLAEGESDNCFGEWMAVKLVQYGAWDGHVIFGEYFVCFKPLSITSKRKMQTQS